jgi:glycine betaine/choline ABC-type transport system substrate-binding protein
MRRTIPCLAVLMALAVAAGAQAQAPPRVRLAAATDCARNINCIPGFKRVYGIDPGPQLVTLKVADAGIQALDDGRAEVALAFSSNPQLSRPDILELADDRHMISADHVVPIVRSSVARRYGRRLRRALDDASKLLSTLELRGLNQEVFDGRLPEAVGGEFADTNGLGGPNRHVSGPAVRIGYQDFDENKTLAYMYAEALRGAGIRVTVRSAGGLRPAVVGAMRDGRIDLWPGYSGSLRGYLGGGDLRRALARIGAQPLALSPAQDRNGFAIRRDVARALGVAKLSDLRRYWSPPARTARARAAQAPASGDPRQGEQWAVGPDSLLNLPAAWALSRGRGVTVAIIDTGAKIDHPDLAPNVWTNFDEIPGNGIDDDHNGYVDDVHGVDLTSKSSGQNLSDGNGHGTHVAGIVAAAANGKGVVGVAPQAKLMIVKVLDSDGARIINMSLGGDRLDTSLQAAIQEASVAGALVVTSAGNSDRDIDQQPSYPASLAEPNLITVASTDPQAGRNLSGFSNFGRLDVQVAAPGSQILSTAKDGGWVLMSGTSMAAPAVSGVAALAASVNPKLSAPDLRALLMQNAARSGLPVTAGYVDALHTVLAASSAAGYDATQPPRLKILSATVKNGRTQVQAAVLGSTTSIRRYRLTLGRKVAELAPRPSPFSIKLAGTSKRVKLAALNRAGRPVTAAQRAVAGLRKGKGDVGRGSPVGT